MKAYICQNCGLRNSAAHQSCRRCAAEPTLDAFLNAEAHDASRLGADRPTGSRELFAIFGVVFALTLIASASGFLYGHRLAVYPPEWAKVKSLDGAYEVALPGEAAMSPGPNSSGSGRKIQIQSHELLDAERGTYRASFILISPDDFVPFSYSRQPPIAVHNDSPYQELTSSRTPGTPVVAPHVDEEKFFSSIRAETESATHGRLVKTVDIPVRGVVAREFTYELPTRSPLGSITLTQRAYITARFADVSACTVTAVGPSIPEYETQRDRFLESLVYKEP